MELFGLVLGYRVGGIGGFLESSRFKCYYTFDSRSVWEFTAYIQVQVTSIYDQITIASSSSTDANRMAAERMSPTMVHGSRQDALEWN